MARCEHICIYRDYTICGNGAHAEANPDVAQNHLSAELETAEAAQARMKLAAVMSRFLLVLSFLFFPFPFPFLLVRPAFVPSSSSPLLLASPSFFFLSLPFLLPFFFSPLLSPPFSLPSSPFDKGLAAVLS